LRQTTLDSMFKRTADSWTLLCILPFLSSLNPFPHREEHISIYSIIHNKERDGRWSFY
jgi:hypothetical protein